MKVGEPFNPYKRFQGAWIPNAVLRLRELNSSDKIVLGRLMQFAGEKGYCWPSQRTLAEELGLTQRYVGMCLGRLLEKGFIRAESARYLFLWHESYGGEKYGSQGVRSMVPQRELSFSGEKYTSGDLKRINEEIQQESNGAPPKRPPAMACEACGGRGKRTYQVGRRSFDVACGCRAAKAGAGR